MNTPDTDNPTPYDLTTGGGYRAARRALNLTQAQLALVVQKSLATIKHREGGLTAIPYEAQVTMRWMLSNPPKVTAKSKARCLTKGDNFGLFTIQQVYTNNTGKPTSYGAHCRCGKAVIIKPKHLLLPGTLCRPNCPAYAAMVERGSQVDANGDIIDKDGFPES